MARNFHRRSPMAAMSEINVTPLIDLAFALLIIFMITAPLLEQSIDINLPAERARAQEPERQTGLTLSLDREGVLYWDGERVGADELALRLQQLVDSGGDPVVSIRADAALPYQRIVDVLDEVKAAGLRKISLGTRGE